MPSSINGLGIPTPPAGPAAVACRAGLPLRPARRRCLANLLARSR